MTMNCSDSKHLIHLDVGNDLRADEEQQLAEHMTSCSDCRAYHVEMSSAIGALLTLRDVDAGVEHKSVWASVSREIQKRRTAPALARRFNLQVAALSVCSLGLAVVTIVQSLSSLRSGGDSSGGYYTAQPVMNVSGSTRTNAPSFHMPPSAAPTDMNTIAPSQLPQSF